MTDGTACLCLGNAHVVELFEVVQHGRQVSVRRWSTLRWIKSQIWTVLTAARELWVLVPGVSAKRALAALACPSYVIEAEVLRTVS